MLVDRTCFTSIWEEWLSYLNLKITLYLTFALTAIQKSQSLKTEKIIFKLVIDIKSKLFSAKII